MAGTRAEEIREIHIYDGAMQKVVAISGKGGVGKTTSTAALGAAFRVIFADEAIRGQFCRPNDNGV